MLAFSGEMNDPRSSSINLQAIARQVMQAQGFQPDFPPETQKQLADIKAHPPQLTPSDKVRDLRNLLWSSIDNDTSKDLDQIEVAERLPNGDIKVMIGIADVDAFVAKDSPIDQHAERETTSVYTGVSIFPMLPKELSTGASSLLENSDRPAVVNGIRCQRRRRAEFQQCVSSHRSQQGATHLQRGRSMAGRHGGRLRQKWPRLRNCRRSSNCRTKLPRRSRNCATSTAR